MKRPWFALAGMVLLAGCSMTQAERQSQEMIARAQSANARGQACQDELNGNPQFAFIARRVPTRWVPPSLEALNDTTRLTADESARLNAWHSGLLACRAHYAEATQALSFMHVAVQRTIWSRADIVYAALSRREITWGDATKQLSAIRGDATAQFAEADRQLQSLLTAQHSAELDRRQAAAASFAASMDRLNQQAQQRQIQMQQQQMLMEMSRPRTTNCQAFGTQVNCQTF